MAENYSHSALIYADLYALSVLPLKYLVNEKGEPCTLFELMNGEKPSVRHLRTLFCPVIVKKHTAMKDKKVVNMRHQAQKGYRGIFVGMPENQEGYLCYVPSIRNTVTSYDALFDKTFSSALAYSEKPYHDAMSMRPGVSFIPCVTDTREQTGDVITFAQFEEEKVDIDTFDAKLNSKRAKRDDAENPRDHSETAENGFQREMDHDDDSMPSLDDAEFLSLEDELSSSEDKQVSPKQARRNLDNEKRAARREKRAAARERLLARRARR